MAEICFTLNDELVTVRVDPGRNLLNVLREELGLTGTKQGCDFEGECGACTVLLDGKPVRSCLTPVGKAAGRRILTVEGLGGPDELHPLQTAFIETGAVQCGYCTPGMLLAAKALLDRDSAPSRQQILEALEGNLCRCTGYTRILMAVELAAARMRGEVLAPDDARTGEDVALRETQDAAPIGGDMRRIDSLPKVTGQARYVEDMYMPGLLHARVLRSPYHHARLVSLDYGKAAQLPGVVRILTAADIPGENGLFDYSRREPILTPVGDTVKMRGAPVAFIVARSPQQALAAAQAIEVVYEPLPFTFDEQETLDEDALPIYQEGNVLSRTRVAHGDLETVLASSDVVLETDYRTAWLEHAALERESVLGYVDGTDGEQRITVVSGTHEPHWQQGYIAGALDLDPSRVRVIVPPTGGSFGGKQDPWPLVATALMVYQVRQPVRLVYSRRESFDASPKRHPYHLRYKIGATQDGHLTGVRVRVDVNTGGYDGHGYYITDYAVTASGGPYRYRAVDALAQSIYTNGPKGGQFRGFGTPQSIFALECTLDELAQKLGADPLEFRVKNAISQSDISFLGYPVAESMGYQEVLAAIRPHYLSLQEKVATFNEQAAGRIGKDVWRKGMGLAGMWYRFGKSGSLRVEAHAELGQEGELLVYCSAPDYGQGTSTVMAQLAAEALDVPRDDVRLVNADTALTPDSGIQGASRATFWVGNAVAQAARHLRQEILATAAELLDCAPSDLTLTGECVYCTRHDRRSVTLQEIAHELDRIGKSRKVLGAFEPDLPPANRPRPEYAPFFVTGAQLAEVTVNVRTGEVRVDRVVAAHDVGRAINPVDAKGQVEGSVVMGLGVALMEEYIPGASTGFSDYYVPTIKSMPDIEVILVEVPSFYGPHGAKGLGEAAILPSTPAFVNAVSRAIGARVRHLPATPERVLDALRHASMQPAS